MPAGTGVCVVKTLLTRVASSASSKVRPWRSMKQADPLQREERGVALVHVEDGGLEPSASSARMPPMPSTISWRMRVSLSPP